MAQIDDAFIITEDDIEELARMQEEAPRAVFDDPLPTPVGLRKQLLYHQCQALKWMVWRESQDPSTGILGDEMGLGKTLTSIALVIHQKNVEGNNFLFRQGNLRASNSTLILCPPNLVNQWYNEILTSTSSRALVYVGPHRDGNIDTWVEHDFIITHPDIMRHEPDDSPLFRIAWRRLVIDEAHEIRNPDTKRFRNACRITAQSKWAVTGTPIQNTIKDLSAYFRFLQLEPFSNDDVWEQIVDYQQNNREPLTASATLRLNLILRCIMLRRQTDTINPLTNQPLIQLPHYQEEDLMVNLSDEEKNAYDQLYELARGNGRVWVANGAQNNPLRYSLLAFTNRLRQVCNHFALMSRFENDEFLVNAHPNLFDPNIRSSKVIMLMNRVSEIVRRGEKCLIMTYQRDMLQILSGYLREDNIIHDLIDGSIKQRDRPPIIQRFNDPNSTTRALLISLRIGYAGLNLVGGNHCFILEMPYNPAVEEQAYARIYRVGQERNVTFYRFITRDTIEENVLNILNSKRELAESIVGGESPIEAPLTIGYIRELFSLDA